LSDVSLIAIVPESECRMPTLMGPVSFFALLASPPAGAAAAALLEAAGLSDWAGPLHPNAAGASAQASKLVQRLINCFS
jgi:hypothetical protein